MRHWHSRLDSIRSNLTQYQHRFLKVYVRNYGRFAQFLFAGLLFFVVGEKLYSHWNDLSSYKWQLDYRWFFVSTLLVSIAILSLAAWWILSLRLLREHISWKYGIKIWALSQLAKYLPGGIWNYVSRMYACDRAGLLKRSTIISLAIEAVLRVQSGIIVFLVSLPFWPTKEWFQPNAFLVLATALLMSLLLLNPYSLKKALKLGSQVLRTPLNDFASLEYKHIIGLLGGHILTVVSVGIAFYLMIMSVYYVPITAALPVTGMLAISVIAGFLNPLTPQGFGTREALLIVLLSYYLPVPVAVVVALLSRLWLIISEVLSALVVMFFPTPESQ
jgi:uncharacterized membrane protein YbhN (UPF0104 family)